ncbi:MAG: glutamate synthase domain-containing protein 2 [Verrucomicrobiales bacterium]|jgi:glutamate synthase domain-containing protein 2
MVTINYERSEGGTGAAPLEFSDSVAMPLEPALIFVDQALRDYGLRDDIRLIASGKMVTAASIVKIFALGADICNGARAFMSVVRCHWRWLSSRLRKFLSCLCPPLR